MLEESLAGSPLVQIGVIHKRPRERQHGDNNPDPPATTQVQRAIIWKPYGLVPFFGYRVYSCCCLSFVWSAPASQKSMGKKIEHTPGTRQEQRRASDGARTTARTGAGDGGE